MLGEGQEGCLLLSSYLPVRRTFCWVVLCS